MIAGYLRINDMKCRVTGAFRSRLPASLQALQETPKREGVPTATVLPCSSDLKTDLFEQATKALVCELVTILGVNGFASHEVNVKVRVLDAYMLLLRALECCCKEKMSY